METNKQTKGNSMKTKIEITKDLAEDLSRAYLDDGNLSIDEINEAFSKLDRSKK